MFSQQNCLGHFLDHFLRDKAYLSPYSIGVRISLDGDFWWMWSRRGFCQPAQDTCVLLFFWGLIVELFMLCWIIMREAKLDHVRGIFRVVNRRYSNCRKTTSSRNTFAEFIWGCPSNQRLYLWVTQPPSQWQIKSFCWHPYTKKCNVILVVTTEKEEQPNLQPPEVSHASPENQPSLEISEFPWLQVNHPFNCWGVYTTILG